MARIREAEKSQRMAEMTQKISSLEFKVMSWLRFYLSR